MTGLRRGTGSAWANTPSEIYWNNGSSWQGAAGTVLYRSNGSSWTEVWRWPEQVTGVGATTIDSTSISVAWTEESWADTYYLGIREYPSGSWSYTTDSSTPHTYSSLSPDTTYEVRVAARIVYDTNTLTGAWSATDTTTTDPAGPDADPTGLSVARLAGSETSTLRLTWSCAATDETGFKIYRSTNGSSFSLLDTVATPNLTQYDDATCDDGTRYWYYVKAYNGYGDSGASNTDDEWTQLAAPSSLSATLDATYPWDEIDVAWTVNSTTEANIELDRNVASAGWSLYQTLAAGTANYTDSGLTEDVYYQYRVRAVHATAPDSAYSNSDGKTTELEPPGVPTSPGATPTDDTAISVSWSLPASGPAPDYYKVYGSTSTGFTVGPATLLKDNEAASPWSHTGLSSNQTWYYRISAVRTGPVEGDPTSEVSATTWPTNPLSFGCSADETTVDASWSNGTRSELKTLEIYDFVAAGWDTISSTVGTAATAYTGFTYGSEHLGGPGSNRIDMRIKFNSEATYATASTYAPV